ncbi:hypothetical protein [Sporomusa sp. KB1]|uniref:hypothetical protein n=1 Tax=Sporomusa sp. KB1 TaxID=943346 RepID=UPI001644C4CD|nr:hypothetical protein [Sporomusa sp. KB1]
MPKQYIYRIFAIYRLSGLIDTISSIDNRSQSRNLFSNNSSVAIQLFLNVSSVAIHLRSMGTFFLLRIAKNDIIKQKKGEKYGKMCKKKERQ